MTMFTAKIVITNIAHNIYLYCKHGMMCQNRAGNGPVLAHHSMFTGWISIIFYTINFGNTIMQVSRSMYHKKQKGHCHNWVFIATRLCFQVTYSTELVTVRLIKKGPSFLNSPRISLLTITSLDRALPRGMMVLLQITAQYLHNATQPACSPDPLKGLPGWMPHTQLSPTQHYWGINTDNHMLD